MTRHGPWGILSARLAKSRPVGQAALAVSSASVVAAGVAFISNVLAARALGPELRGNVAFALQIAYFGAPLLALGADRILLRDSSTGLHGAAVPKLGFMVLVASGSTVPIFFFAPPEMAIVPWIALTTAWFSLERAASIGDGRVKGYLRNFYGYQLTIAAVHAVLYVLGVTHWAVWVAVYALPVYAVARSRYPARAKRMGDEASGITVPTGTNGSFVVAALAQMVVLRAERLLLPILAGPASLGLYVVVATATEPLYWLAQSLADHNVSRSGLQRSQGHRIRSLVRMGILFSLLVAPIAVGLWYLLTPVFGESFSSARSLILPLSLAAISLGLYRQTAAWILASSRPRRLGLLEGGVAILGLAVYPIGILLHGADGAAWASCAVYTGGALLGLHLARDERTRRQVA